MLATVPLKMARTGAVLAVLALVPASAAAQEPTTFGDEGLSDPAVPGPPASGTFVLDVADEPGYASPIDGVVSAVAVKGGPGAGGRRVTPVAVRRRDDGTHLVVAVGVAESLADDDLTTLWPRLPVRKGDRLALAVEGGEPVAIYRATPGSSMHRVERDALPNSGDELPAGTPIEGFAPLWNAVVEPDDDGDGHGDHTQDRCPADPATADQCAADLALVVGAPCAGLCAIATVPAFAGSPFGFHVHVVNRGPGTARSVKIDADVFDAPMVQALPPHEPGIPWGSCFHAGTRAACELGDVPPVPRGEGLPSYTFVAIPPAPGVISFSAVVTSSTSDPDPHNNISHQLRAVPPRPAAPGPPQARSAPPVVRAVRIGRARFDGTRVRVTLTVPASGRLTVSGRLPWGRLAPQRRSVRRARTVTLALPVARRLRPRIARALRARRRVRLRVTATLGGTTTHRSVPITR